MSAVAYGHERPLVDPARPGAEALNKRVDLVVVLRGPEAARSSSRRSCGTVKPDPDKGPDDERRQPGQPAEATGGGRRLGGGGKKHPRRAGAALVGGAGYWFFLKRPARRGGGPAPGVVLKLDAIQINLPMPTTSRWASPCRPARTRGRSSTAARPSTRPSTCSADRRWKTSPVARSARSAEEGLEHRLDEAYDGEVIGSTSPTSSPSRPVPPPPGRPAPLAPRRPTIRRKILLRSCGQRPIAVP